MPEKQSSSGEELRKARRNKVIYLLAGIGLFGLGIVLFVFFIATRDLPELLLGCVAFVWGALLINQAMRSRDLEDLLKARLSEGEEEGSGGREGGTSRPGEEAGEAEAGAPPGGERDEP